MHQDASVEYFDDSDWTTTIHISGLNTMKYFAFKKDMVTQKLLDHFTFRTSTDNLSL